MACEGSPSPTGSRREGAGVWPSSGKTRKNPRRKGNENRLLERGAPECRHGRRQENSNRKCLWRHLARLCTLLRADYSMQDSQALAADLSQAEFEFAVLWLS